MNLITLKAKIEDKVIYIYWSMKWRPIRYYGRNGIPSNKIIKDVIRIFKSRAGMSDSQEIALHVNFQSSSLI